MPFAAYAESFHQVWSLYDHPLPSYSALAADAYVTLWSWPLTFWPWLVSHIVNHSTDFEDPTAIRSWVMSSVISHRIPLTMRPQPLRMRRITWPMRRGQIFPNSWNPWLRIAYSLYNIYGDTTTFKGRLLSARPIVKAVFERKYRSTVEIGLQNGDFEDVNVKF